MRGRLYSFDQHMNLVLEDAEDVTNAESTKKLGTIIVRGDNVVLVSPPPKRYIHVLSSFQLERHHFETKPILSFELRFA